MTYMRVSTGVLALVAMGACASVAQRPTTEWLNDKPAPWPRTTDGRIERARPLVVAAEFELPTDLLLGLIWVESRFRPDAVSGAGARGLTQLMPGTAGDMAERLGLPRHAARPHDPSFAVRAGAAYLRLMLDKFHGDVNTALAAYAAGPGRVRKRLRKDGGLPSRARRYAGKVQRARRRFRPAPRGPSGPLS